MCEKTVVFITGANTGIGYETVRALVGQSSRAYHIFLGTRTFSKGERAASDLRAEFPETKSVIEIITIDVLSDESINAAYETVKAGLGYVDVLVNNAGAAFDIKVLRGEATIRETWQAMYDVNVTGAQVVTHTFAPLLLASRNGDARLVFLASGTAQLQLIQQSYYPGPAPATGWPKKGVMSADGYRTSKTALNMMMQLWHWNLKDDGVKVWAVSPGFLATDLGGVKERLKAAGARDASVGGKLIQKVIEGERDGDVGSVVNEDGVQPF